MLHRHDHDFVVEDRIRYNVARAGNDKFARALDPARSAKIRVVGKAGYGTKDRSLDAFCGGGVMPSDVAGARSRPSMATSRQTISIQRCYPLGFGRGNSWSVSHDRTQAA